MNRNVVRAIFVCALLITAVQLNSIGSARAKEPRGVIRPAPLFADPAFSFGQVDSICLAPILDLRSDKSVPVFLIGETPEVNLKHLPNASGTLYGNLDWLGYRLSWCNQVTATPSDLIHPSDAWLRSLDFGQSKWLLIVAVDALSATPNASTGIHPMGIGVRSGFAAGHAVASGYLFEKTPDSAKLVWRDRMLGLDHSGGVIGFTSAYVYSTNAVNTAVQNLVWEFDQRSKKRQYVYFAGTNVDINAPCDAVWDALKGALNEDPKQYHIAMIDDTDKLALFGASGFHGDIGGNEDRVILRSHDHSCGFEVTQSFRTGSRNDWDSLIKQVGESVSK